MNIHFLIRKFRYRKLKVLENYLAFAGDDNNYIHSEEFRILDFELKEEAKDIYLKYFIGNGLARISTWKDNSNDGRKSKNMGKRKNFECRIPEGHR